MTAPRLDIRGSGQAFAVFDGKRQVSRIFTTWASAAPKANRLEREARSARRDCLCCGVPFLSLGRGHRLCARCRRSAG